ncbi:MAG: PPC domain-containing protein [Planctomycetota bacterium]|nr:PPC domain-containing protein [Planctomycetota bacterium]
MRPRHAPLLVSARLGLTLIAALALSGSLAACGGGGGGGGPPVPVAGTCVTGNGPPVTVDGTVLYERLTLTSGVGLTLPLITRPARFVDVEVRVAGAGTCYGRTSTDASGAYSITVMPPAGSTLEVVAFSRTLADAGRDVIVHNAIPPASAVHGTGDAFFHVSTAFAATGSPTVDLTVPYNPGTSNRPSIGFGVLDTILTCLDKVQATPGAGTLPRCDVYTSLGNNFAIGTSNYSRVRELLAIAGGAAGNLDASDTDYFDESVVAHEFHHFVEDHLSHSVTRGGFHSLAELIFAGFAFSEGMASAFGNLCIGTPAYIDSTNTSGGLLGEWDVDVYGGTQPLGIGGEVTVFEVMYDLGDGGPGNPADTDGDAIGLPISELYQAYFSFNQAADAPYIGLFLDRLVAISPTLTTGAVTTLLAGTPGDPGGQAISYPLTGSDVWPIPLAVPSSPSGTADSTFGVNKNRCNGIDSVIWYRLSLPSAQTVTLSLTMTPLSGTGNLDLFLSNNATPFTPLAFSNNAGTTAEQIGPINLPAGEYLVRVEATDCLGAGVAASFTLTAN